MRTLLFSPLAVLVLFGQMHAQMEVSQHLSSSTQQGIPIEAMWDVQFNYDATAVTGAAGNAGAVYIHTLNEIWTSRWASAILHRWNPNGTLIAEFSVAGVTGTRNMAFDGTHVFHATATNTVHIVDPVTRTRIGGITLPAGVTARFISFDPSAAGGAGGFWVGDWTAGNLHYYLVSRTGALLNTINNTTITGTYGVAYDNWSSGGPYLWVWHQGGGQGFPQVIRQILVSTGQPTGVMHDVLTDVGIGNPNAIAGGLFITDQVIPGTVTLGGMLQGTPDRLFGYELVTLDAGPLAPFNLTSPAAGATITSFPSSTTPVTFTWDTSRATATYKWIFGSPSVPPRIFTVPASTNSFTMTLGELDNLLAGAGVAQGDSLVGQWDVWAFRNNPPDNDSLKAANGPRALTLKRAMPQLTAFNLLSPSSGTTIVTSPFNTGTINFVWNRSGGGVTYRVKFGSPTIATVLFDRLSNGGGFDSVYSIVNASLDAVLAGFGIPPGDSVVGQWAVWAYAGGDSLRSTQVFGITLKRQGLGDVLVVYDSTVAGGRDSRDSVMNVLNALNITFDLRNKGTITAGPGFTMRGYKKVIWLGQATSVMSAPQRDSVKAYLNAGGTTPATKSKIIVFAEDIGWQHGRPGSANLDLDLCNNYLGFNYVADRPPTGANQGLIGVAINPGQADSTVGAWPDVLAPFGTGTAGLYLFRRHPDSLNAIGKMASRWNAATFGVDVRSLRRAIDSPPGGPVTRMLTAALNYVDELTGGTPAISVSPTSISQTLSAGDSVDVPIRIRNTGAAPLNWSAVANMFASRPITLGTSTGSIISHAPGAGEIDRRWNGRPASKELALLEGAFQQYPTDPLSLENTTVVYVDSMNGANDTTALKARGYKVYYRGTGPQGTTAVWFQGNAAVFPAFNGPPNGYVAANYNAVTGTNTIDNWLVLPARNIQVGDTIGFYERSPAGSTWPDSIRVMYSAAGDSVPEAGSWVELGRFKTTTDGSWMRRTFTSAAPGSNARFAIRYRVANGGPTGANSDYIGIDMITITRGGVVPPTPWLRLVGPTSGTVAPGDSTTLTARLHAVVAAALRDTTLQGSITITSNDPANPTVNIPVSLTFGPTSVRPIAGELPESYELAQNFPNPFNPTTTIRYALPFESSVMVSIFNVVGQEVARLVNERQAPGRYEAIWDGRNATGVPVGSGVYFYRIEATASDRAQTFVDVKKMIYLK